MEMLENVGREYIAQVVATGRFTAKDGEILGLDADGRLIQWDAETQTRYNCGETPEEFGLENLRSAKLERIGRADSREPEAEDASPGLC